MSKEYTEKKYKEYMFLVDKLIENTKIMMDRLPQYEKVSKLSYVEWVKLQNRNNIG